MVKTCISFFCLFFGFLIVAKSQSLLTSGQIIFEKKTNVKLILQDMANENSFYSRRLEDFSAAELPAHVIAEFSLSFNRYEASYAPLQRYALQSEQVYTIPFNNTVEVINTYKEDSLWVTKDVFDSHQRFRKDKQGIRWRITDEYRDILGYNCRRANGVTADSVYVVAFFTNQIPYFAGPETFLGLPGMILGIALPSEHLTWFATSVVNLPDSQQLPESRSNVKTSELHMLIRKIRERKLDASYTLRLLRNLLQ